MSIYEKFARNWQRLIAPPRVIVDGKIWALRTLFEMQNSTIEHSFPHEKAAIIDWILSDSVGDIYRSATEIQPHFGYIYDKWSMRVVYYISYPPLSGLQAGDWDEIREQVTDPTYKPRRDKWLQDLAALRDATVQTAMEPKRKTLMLAVLDLQKACVYWFESLDPGNPPITERDKLTDAISEYFPQFWEEK